MTITACIGFSDEGSLLTQCLDILFSAGVDTVVIANMTRADTDTEPLRRQFGGRSDITLLEFRQSESTAVDYVQTMVSAARERCAPDWLLFGDADEFWIPRRGDLRTMLASCEYDILQVPRFNLVLEDTPGEPLPHDPSHPDGPLMFVGVPANSPALAARTPDFRWSAGQVGGKVLARASMIDRLTLGMHDVVSPAGTAPRRAVASDLIIAHLPFTTPERFRYKVQGIREVMACHGHRLTGDQAWHWRRWLELEDAGLLDEEFRRQLLTRDAIERGRVAGILQTPEEYFRHADAARLAPS